jgi:hypothetical protein
MGRSIQPDYLTTRSQYLDSDIMEKKQYQENITCDISRSIRSDASSGYCTDKEHK